MDRQTHRIQYENSSIASILAEIKMDEFWLMSFDFSLFCFCEQRNSEAVLLRNKAVWLKKVVRHYPWFITVSCMIWYFEVN